MLTKLMPIINELINDNNVLVSKAAKAMQFVRKHPNQYGPLNLCYMACNDKNGVVDFLYNSITEEWQNV